MENIKNKHSDTADKKLEKTVTLRMKKNLVDLVDKEREKFSSPRTSWIIQAVVEKLEKLGYEIE
ncbi:MAG: hypothetical protein DGJ47_001066 [Rickettsiaceae bacterium]